jgi:hypothetical protein
MNPLSAATSSLLSASAQFGAASTSLVRSTNGTSSQSPVQAVGDQTMAADQFKASTKLMTVAESMMGALLNMVV